MHGWDGTGFVRPARRQPAAGNFAAGMYRMRWGRGSGLVALALLALARGRAAAQPAPRYSLVHGCYAWTTATGRSLADAGRVRRQATALGRYLPYRPDSTFLAAQNDGSVSPASEPSPAADWLVKP